MRTFKGHTGNVYGIAVGVIELFSMRACETKLSRTFPPPTGLELDFDVLVDGLGEGPGRLEKVLQNNPLVDEVDVHVVEAGHLKTRTRRPDEGAKSEPRC